MNNKIRAINYSYTKIPTYEIGPIKVNGKYAKGEFNVCLTCTESPLIPSVKRGMKVANLAGGIKTKIIKDEMTRAPVIKAEKEETKNIQNFIKNNFKELEQVANATTNYGKLSSIETKTHNGHLYIRIGMSTADAAGHNMVEKGSQAIMNFLKEKFNFKLISISSNYCTDKKPSKINKEKGRGKWVKATVSIPKELLKKHLKTTPEELIELNQAKNIDGSKLAGSLGENAHFANIAGAIFLATGQDIANVVESSLGKTEVKLKDNLEFSVELPSLIIGSVGGGTNLEYAKENLKKMECYGNGVDPGIKARKFAEIIAATILAGELSLMAALTNNDELLKTHMKFERNE